MILLLKGETVVYGTASAVENIETEPTIQFKTIVGEDLLCTAERAVALAVEKRIGQQIGMRGVAQFELTDETDGMTLRQKTFHAGEVTPYVETPLVEAMQSISAQFGAAFADWNGEDLYL